MNIKRNLFFIFLAGCILCMGCSKEEQTQTLQTSNVQETSNPVSETKVDSSLLTNGTTKHSVSESLMGDDCSTYKAMEEQADLIVYGTKVDEFFKEPDFEGDTYDLMSAFQIGQSIKAGDTNYKEGDTIIIAEGITYDADCDTIYHEGGYQNMQTGKAYYLMLGKGDTKEQYYIIGGVYGKIPEDTKEPVLYESDEWGKVSEEQRTQTEQWIERNRKELK